MYCRYTIQHLIQICHAFWGAVTRIWKYGQTDMKLGGEFRFFEQFQELLRKGLSRIFCRTL